MQEKHHRRFARWIIILLAVSLLGNPMRSASATSPTVYAVQPGDTLSSIASMHGVSVGDLATANGLTLYDVIYSGQVLAIPQAGDPSAGNELVTDPRVPNPLPILPTLPQGPSGASELSYARVTRPYVLAYHHPALAYLKMPAARSLGNGYLWVSVQREVEFMGQTWYEINPGEYVPADALWFYTPSTFQGIALASQPDRPFAWVLHTIQPRSEPAGQVNSAAPAYGRYRIVQIYASESANGQTWYLIGPYQWVEATAVAVVHPNPAPPGVPGGGAWVDVNLLEQTLAAYEGGRMVYATLISSGLDGWNTPTGLFSVWHRTELGKMSGSEGYSDYYFLEDVPWSLFFHGAYALHAAYWHNDFGYPHSHGCVNLAPADAQWLYGWAPQALQVRVH